MLDLVDSIYKRTFEMDNSSTHFFYGPPDALSAMQ